VRRLRVVAASAVAVALAGAGFVVTTAAASAAVTGCRVDYRVTNQWSGGFGADVTVTNLGDPITAWTLTWTYAAGQSVTQAWNAIVTQSGTAVTARNVSYNGSIATNGSVGFGFNGAWTTANPVPAAFALNGTPCTGAPSVTPCPPPVTPTAAPTTPPAQGPVTVWLAGDSTVANPSSSGACPVGWGNQFASYFNSNVTVVNSAIGGRSIQTWLYDPNVTSTMNSAGECVVSPATYSTRWQAMLNASTGMKSGDYLFIQFGINDGSTTCPRHVGSARYKELLGVMASAAKARGARPVFLTPAAAISCSGSSATGNRGYLTETFDAGTANGVPVIDLHRLSYTLYTSVGLCPNNGDYTQGAVGAFFCNDHTHFEAYGARRIARLVTGALRTQNIPLAGSLL
jgi:lysophospholipase L1-like esterase